jgi:hypothetical protein
MSVAVLFSVIQRCDYYDFVPIKVSATLKSDSYFDSQGTCNEGWGGMSFVKSEFFKNVVTLPPF